MAEIISLEINANVGDAVNATKSLKQQLKEANNEAQLLAQKYGESSREAVEAAKKAALIKEEISDLKQRMDALNPESRFKAITQVAGSIANGFQAAQGAMALFGTQSKAVEETLLKVQAASAFAEGLNGLAGITDAMKNFKLIAIEAFTALRTAIGASGIGLLVLAIGAAVTAMFQYKESVDSASRAQGILNDLRDRFNKRTLEQIEYEGKLAKARGESGLKEEVKLEKTKQDQIIKIRQETLNKISEVENKIKQVRQEQQKTTDKDELLLLKVKEEQYTKELEKLLKERYKINNDLLKQNNDLNIARTQLAHEQEVNQFKNKEEKKTEILQAEQAKRIESIGYNNEQQYKLSDQLAQGVIKVDEITNEQRAKQLADIELREIQSAERKRQAVLQASSDTLNGITALGDAFIKDQKKLEKFNKGAALVQIAIDTAKAISALVAASQSNPFNAATAGGAGIAQFAAGIAQILTNVAKAKQILSSAGSTAAPSLGGVSSGGGFNSGNTAPSISNTPNQQGTILNAQNIANSNIDQNYVKAIVVETDITQSQNRVGTIQRRSQIG